VAQALRNPKVLAAVQEQVGRYEQAAAQAKQQYAEGLEVNTTLALTGLFAHFPELQGVPPSGLATAIQMINRTAPERGEAISRYIQNVSALLSNTFQVREQQRQQAEQTRQAQIQQYATQYQDRWNNAAKDADADFDAYRKSEGISDAQAKEITKEAVAMLRNYGLSDEVIAREYNTNWAWRSPIGQRVLMNATRWEMAHRALSQKVAPRQVPPIQHPGAGRAVMADAQDYELQVLSRKLDKTSNWKDGAALLNARRARK